MSREDPAGLARLHIPLQPHGFKRNGVYTEPMPGPQGLAPGPAIPSGLWEAHARRSPQGACLVGAAGGNRPDKRPGLESDVVADREACLAQPNLSTLLPAADVPQVSVTGPMLLPVHDCPSFPTLGSAWVLQYAQAGCLPSLVPFHDARDRISLWCPSLPSP